LRVISGIARGRRLIEPSGPKIRQTSDKVKESVFNIVQFDIEGRRVLDLFAGTGQIGIEALSRGAKSAVFVDSNPDAVKLVWQNLKLCGLAESASVYTRDALKFIENDEQFDLIYIDPPYDTTLARNALGIIIRFDKLKSNGIILCETKADYTFPDVSKPYFLQKEYRYSGVKITRYTRID